MDVGYRSPLFDLLRGGGADRGVRLLAARGALSPHPVEQLALLAWLTADPDETISAAAEATIARVPAAALRAFLTRPDMPPALCTFCRQRLGEEAGAEAVPPEADPPPPAQGTPEAEETLGAAQRLSKLPVADRIKVAMQGSREERTILVRDANRLVASAVLNSPKLSESEVEAIARMTNVSEDVLRTIGTSRQFVKNYGVVAGLVRNPKTPVGISMTLLNRLLERDLKTLSTDRNVAEVLRLTARKLLVNSEARKR